MISVKQYTEYVIVRLIYCHSLQMNIVYPTDISYISKKTLVVLRLFSRPKTVFKEHVGFHMSLETEP